MQSGPLQLSTPSWSTAQAPAPSAAQALARIRGLLAEHKVGPALELADRSVRSWPDHEPLLLTAAALARRVGRPLAAFQLLSHAEHSGSDRAAAERRVLINEAAPYWHFRMMNDEVRNRAYDLALRRYVTPDSLVLDIGCGAGLLSMMAARAGARQVYACELAELMAHQARRIIARNGFDEQITVINKISNRLEVGRDLPTRADVIVAEVFDTGLLGEQALRTFAHAREHLLKPGGVVLPLSASVQAVLIESELLHKEVVASRCCGFDVGILNEFTPPYFQARLDAFPHRVLGPDLTVGGYHFGTGEDSLESDTIGFTVTRGGTCHGVGFWFTLDFGDDIRMSTGPENRWNCWMQAVSAFDEPVELSPGDCLAVRIERSNDRILSFVPA